MRLQESGGQEDVGKETVETTEKEGKQETVDTPLTSPSDDVIVQVKHCWQLTCRRPLYEVF